MENFYAIVPAGGAGTRFNAAQPKQYALMNGVPVIQRAVHIHPTVSELIPTLLGDLKEFV